MWSTVCEKQLAQEDFTGVLKHQIYFSFSEEVTQKRSSKLQLVIITAAAAEAAAAFSSFNRFEHSQVSILLRAPPLFRASVQMVVQDNKAEPDWSLN